MNLPTLRRHGALLSTIALALSLGACETDLDPNDDYRETTFIYAILDPAQVDANGQPVQRISIQKAFLNTRTNALTIAANEPDSVTFRDGAIAAELQFLRADSSLKLSYPLTRVPNPDKPTGTFATPGQVVYQTPVGFPGLDADTTVSYRVVARNTRTGTTAQGATSVPLRWVRDRINTLWFRAAYSTSYNNLQQSDLREFDPAPLSTPRVEVQSQRRAGIYSVEMDFRFLEINGTDTVRRTLTWPIITNFQPDITTPNPRVILANESFFTDFLLRQLQTANDPVGLTRRIPPNCITFRAYAGSSQWGQYINVLNSSSAIIQTTPEYTNVRGGRGLVAGRVQHTVTQFINTVPGSRAIAAFNRYPQLKFRFN